MAIYKAGDREGCLVLVTQIIIFHGDVGVTFFTPKNSGTIPLDIIYVVFKQRELLLNLLRHNPSSVLIPGINITGNTKAIMKALSDTTGYFFVAIAVQDEEICSERVRFKQYIENSI